MRFAGPVMMHSHQAVQFPTQRAQLIRGRDTFLRMRHRRGGRGCGFRLGPGPFGHLPSLPFPQQRAHLLGVEQSGDPEIIGFFRTSGKRGRAERRPIVDHLVQFGVRGQRDERFVVLPRLVLLLVRFDDQFVVEPVLLPVRFTDHMVAL